MNTGIFMSKKFHQEKSLYIKNIQEKLIFSYTKIVREVVLYAYIYSLQQKTPFCIESEERCFGVDIVCLTFLSCGIIA